MAVAKKTPAKRVAKKVVAKVKKAEEAVKVDVKKVEKEAKTLIEKIEDKVEDIIEEVKDGVEKVEDAFESWWENTAMALLRKGHSDKNVLISAAEQNGGNYSAFAKEKYPDAVKDHGSDIKKIAKVAFDHVPQKK